MIKRLLIAVALIALPSLALATGRDILLTSDGTLYAVESVYADGLNVTTPSSQVLMLTTRNDAGVTSEIIPATLLGGSHITPALAYDSESKTLFVFWQRGINNGLTSDLVFSSRRDGQWSELTSIDSASYHWAHNISVGITRKTDRIDENGNHSTVPQLTVHTTWWEEAGGMEWARYAMLTIDNGLVSDIEIRDLSSFVDTSRDVAGPNDADSNVEILRHPVLFESTGHETIDAVFGDMSTHNMHRVTIQPALDLRRSATDGRIHIPIGKADAGLGAPRFRSDANAAIAAVDGSNGELVFYLAGQGSVKYVTFDNGAWSAMRSIETSGAVSTDAAVEVLRQMANSE